MNTSENKKKLSRRSFVRLNRLGHPGIKLKVLPLTTAMTSSFFFDDDLAEGFYTPSNAVLGRPGIYLRGDQCWFELPDGRAFGISKERFLYEIAGYDALRLTSKLAEVLRQLIAGGLATKHQCSLYYRYRDAMAARAVLRNTMKVMLRTHNR